MSRAAKGPDDGGRPGSSARPVPVLAIGEASESAGLWLLASGFWLLASGFWLLAVDI
jgi:hypothetical protein